MATAGPKTLRIVFTGTAPQHRIGYRIKNSGSAFTYLNTYVSSSPVEIPGLAQGEYEVEVTGVCDQGALSDPVTSTANGPVTVNFVHTKSEDPMVDIVLVPLVNGQNTGNKYATQSGTLNGIYPGDTVQIVLGRSPTTVAWPVGGTGGLQVLADGTPIFNSGQVYSATSTLTSFTFVPVKGVIYTVSTTSEGNSANYRPVILEQVNNSSHPVGEGSTPPVNFLITDNTNGEMVWNDGGYTNPQIHGFNYLDQGGALADQATLTISPLFNLRFTIQSHDGTSTYWSNLDVAAGASVTLATLPKESIKITYIDTP